MEMMTSPSQTIPISSADSSQIGHARRQALALSASMGFGELRQGQLGIIVTEAARNIAAHADRGEIVLSAWIFGDGAGIDVFALDQGQGIADVPQSFQDGYSTSGTPGQGLGAMLRLAGDLQIYTTPDKGTALFARVFREPRAIDRDPSYYALGAISLPITGESVCGDAWSSNHIPGRSIYIVADGLGHGPKAAEAAEEAVRIFHDVAAQAPERILGDIHRALSKTRGAAVSIAEILHDRGMLNYAGAGNIVAGICAGGKTRSMVSMNGTVGHSVAKIQQFSYPWEKNSALIMHSDGLATRWNVELYPGLASRHPALMAAVLYRDFSRKRDDATILVSRI
jgi:anti-sigma regulatory factor (Ser/Thr protein kinase)